MILLLDLLRSALHETPLDNTELERFRALDATAWQGLLSEAERQSVTGLVYQAVSYFPDDFEMPEGILFQLVGSISQIEAGNRALEQASDKLIVEMQADGFHPLLMKGATIAALYPKPQWREYGDIDLYLKPEEFDLLPAFSTRNRYVLSKSPDKSYHFSYYGIDVDIHRSYFDLYGRAAKPPVPSSEAMLLMLSAHILKHCVGPGAGLRQVCDMAAGCLKLDGKYDPALLVEYAKENRIDKWNKLLFSFLSTYLEIPDRLYSSNKTSPEPLMNIISEGGNFGHYSTRRQSAFKKAAVLRKADTARAIARRLPFALKYAPGQGISILLTLLRGNFGRK